MCFAAWFVACQTLMTFSVVFEFLALAVFPCCMICQNNTKWLWSACFITGMISTLHFLRPTLITNITSTCFFVFYKHFYSMNYCNTLAIFVNRTLEILL